MKKALYLGTDPTRYPFQKPWIHYPLIHIVPRPLEEPALQQAYRDLSRYTHWIFTSRQAVRVMAEHRVLVKPLPHQQVWAIGRGTQAALHAQGVRVDALPRHATQEGICALLAELSSAYVFLPKSALSRPLLSNYCQQRAIPYQDPVLYDTQMALPDMALDWAEIDEIIFTSPSTVRAFLTLIGPLPRDKQWTAIGPITQAALHTEKTFS